MAKPNKNHATTANVERSQRAMLSEGAERSEADIAAGRVNTIEEAKAKAKAALRQK